MPDSHNYHFQLILSTLYWSYCKKIISVIMFDSLMLFVSALKKLRKKSKNDFIKVINIDK